MQRSFQLKTQELVSSNQAEEKKGGDAMEVLFHIFPHNCLYGQTTIMQREE
jgi:hypothetical protein